MERAKRATRQRAPQATDKHVANRIRMRRHMLGLSQGAVGEAIGITFQQVQKYENGANRISAGRLQQIADALDCQPAWFFAGRPRTAGDKRIEAQHVDADLSAFYADRYAAELVPGLVRLGPRVKRAIVKVISAAAGRPEKA
jgi:transcriptional regulator with XRE-family HTH domain